MDSHEADILVIGSGLAGCAAALGAARAGGRVTMLTKAARPEESNTLYAQGGVIYRSRDDSPELLARDIIVAGRVYDSLTDVIAVCSAWGVDVGAALHDEIARCARVGLAADAPRSESALPRKRVLRRFPTADRHQRSN